jgi:hypothetical protein
MPFDRQSSWVPTSAQAVGLPTAAFESAVANRNVLVLSPYLPPSTLAGVHRARHLAKHLPAFGWTPIVVCVHESHHEELLDPDLCTLMPVGVEVIKVEAVSARLTRYIGVGDISIRAWKYLKRKVFDLLKAREIDAVLITGAPFYPMLLAPEIKRRFGIPVVLDFQDPWVSAWGAAQPAFSKAGLSNRLARLLEPRALSGADFVTSVSDIQNSEMTARYPWFNSAHMAAIPIGGDPDDFKALQAKPAVANDFALEPGLVHLSYVGTALPKSKILFRTLLRAFAKLRAAEPTLSARVRLNFIGTSNQPNDNSTYRVKPIAEEIGIVDSVCEIPRRIPFLQALNIIAQSSGLLLIGSDEPHYTASKIYPALMSGRPFLSLFHCASSAHALLAKSGGGKAFAFETAEELASLEPSLAESLRDLALYPDKLGTINSASYAPFEAKNIARRFANVFDLLAGR